ncbi:MAG: lytic transglycosylase domain-containing protein [Ruminococcaceae bacterium]|nr:lytic transglycosylase domain-containing protein [Oscillospiraceae bacterium]
MKKITRKITIALLIVFILTIFLYKPVMKMYYPLKHEVLIENISSKYNVDKYLVMGVISAESRFDINAKSHKGAKGLMQLTDSTAMWCNNNFNLNYKNIDLFSAETNIEIGCIYLEYLIDTYESIETALAAYNAGPGNVNKWLKNENYSKDGKTLDVIPYGETKDYVEKVTKRRNSYFELYGNKKS